MKLYLLPTILVLVLLSSCEGTKDQYASEIIRSADQIEIRYLSQEPNVFPVFKSGKRPSHPDSQRWKRGFARVRFTVNTKGKTEDIKVVESEGLYFGGNTAYAIRFWRFHPATKDGQPIACEAEYAIHFRGLHSPGVND